MCVQLSGQVGGAAKWQDLPQAAVHQSADALILVALKKTHLMMQVAWIRWVNDMFKFEMRGAVFTE